MYSKKNLTKTVKRLPETLCKSFYKATKDVPFDKCGTLHHSLLHETEPPDKKHLQISKGQTLPVLKSLLLESFTGYSIQRKL